MWGKSLTSLFYTWLCNYLGTLCMNKYSFSIEWSWQPCQKSTDHGCMSLSLDFQLNSTDLCLSLSHWSDYCCFVVSFEIRTYESPTFYFFFKILLTMLGLLQFHTNFKNSFLIYTISWYSDRDYIETVDQLRNTSSQY